MIVHSDLVQCATDLVMGKDSPLTNCRGDEFTVEATYSGVREAAAVYLIALFEDAGKPEDGG